MRQTNTASNDRSETNTAKKLCMNALFFNIEPRKIACDIATQSQTWYADTTVVNSNQRYSTG